jgi:hypothetical protein
MNVSNGDTVRVLSALNGTGNISIGGKSVVEIGGSAASGQTISFADGNNELVKIDNPTAFNAALSNWMIGDTVDLAKTVVQSVALSGNTLTLTTAGGQTLSYQVSGAFTGNHFAALSDGAGGTDLVLLAPGASQWGTFDLPAQPTPGVHILNNQLQADAALNQFGIAYATTPNYNPSGDPSGPYTETRYALALDPFFLQTNTGSQLINTSSVTQPARANFQMFPTSTTNGVQGEGLDSSKRKTAAGKTSSINRFSPEFPGAPRSTWQPHSAWRTPEPTPFTISTPAPGETTPPHRLQAFRPTRWRGTNIPPLPRTSAFDSRFSMRTARSHPR